MYLKLSNHIISSPMITILTRLKMESHGLLSDIKDIGKEIKITCPYHKNGQENHPSCFVCANENMDVEYGTFHCFTCGESGSLSQLVAHCLHIPIKDSQQWLIDNFSDILVQDKIILEDIKITPEKKTYLDPNILKQYNFYHPYMWHRKLTKEVVDAFCVGFDHTRNAITFPVWDIANNLVMITARAVDRKKFYIDKLIEKPVYLLNFVQMWNIDKVIVCESQLNALCAWTWGYPAVALIGTGGGNQYNILNSSSIRHYVLAFDGDEAGNKGRERFLQHIRKDVFVETKVLPPGKDLNDLSKEEFDKLVIN